MYSKHFIYILQAYFKILNLIGNKKWKYASIYIPLTIIVNASLDKFSLNILLDSLVSFYEPKIIKIYYTYKLMYAIKIFKHIIQKITYHFLSFSLAYYITLIT